MYVVDGIAYAGEPTRGIKVAAIKVLANLCMLVEFTSGETRLFDMTTLLGVPAFSGLKNETAFNTAVVDHGVVCWLDGVIDIAPETMYAKSFEYEKII